MQATHHQYSAYTRRRRASKASWQRLFATKLELAGACICAEEKAFQKHFLEDFKQEMRLLENVKWKENV